MNVEIIKNGEIILINSHISPYKQASYSNHSPTDERKLLLNKREINKLIGKMQRDGFTIVPTKMYFKKGKAKIELAVAKEASCETETTAIFTSFPSTTLKTSKVAGSSINSCGIV